jgi:LuxR family maltose regulon positive regulatory protein
MADYGESLSEREMDVLNCVAEGASNKEAAARLFISQNTVKVHLRNIYTKLGVSSRTEAVTQAMQLGLIAMPGAAETAVPPRQSKNPHQLKNRRQP